MEPPPPKPPPDGALPTPSELSKTQLEFLNKHISSHEDLLTKAPLLSSDLTHSYRDLEASFINLQRNLIKRTVSWISHSFGAKSSIADLNYMLEALSLRTYQYEFCSTSMNMKKIMEELPQLVKCLKRIEFIRNYVDIALQLEKLVGDLEDAVYSIGDSHSRNAFLARVLTSLISTDFDRKQERLLRAVEIMNTIEDILIDVVKSHPQWSHLLESVDVRVDKSLAVVRPQILADHRALLASLGWPPNLLASKPDAGEYTSLPNPLVLMEGGKRKCYSQSFIGLCALQHLQTRRADRRHSVFGRKECTTRLWAIDELVSPIASRMEYHFSKWVEQPEFSFALVYKITRDFIAGVDDVLQPLIDRERLVSYSAREAWVLTMVEILSGFLSKSVFSVLAKSYKDTHMKPEVASSWLHLIDHMVSFDKQIQSLVSSEICYFLESGRHYEPPRGLSVLTLFCDKPDWLKIWAKIELKDAWKKLKLDLKDERVWSMDKKSGVSGQLGTESEECFLTTGEYHKAPLVTESVMKIAWEMIERCQSLHDVLLRARFIRSTAGKLLWHFFNVLVLRSKNAHFHMNCPNNALIRVSGSINAARYIESKLQEWNDDVNFVEMCITERDLEMNGSDGGANDNSFFREEVKSLSELETTWLIEVITAILQRFEALSWEYLQNMQHFEQGPEILTSAATDLGVSSDIVEALETVKSELNILKSSLNPKDFLDLWRGIADGLDHFISKSISMIDAYLSIEGTDQFKIDMQAMFSVFRPFCARPEVFFPCIRETLRLLKMSREEANKLQSVRNDVENRTKWLHSVGISHLSFDQVHRILTKRKLVT